MTLLTDTDIGTYQLYEKGEPGMHHLVLKYIIKSSTFLISKLFLYVSDKIFIIVLSQSNGIFNFWQELKCILLVKLRHWRPFWQQIVSCNSICFIVQVIGFFLDIPGYLKIGKMWIMIVCYN